MQGIFIDGPVGRSDLNRRGLVRPKSKKEIKECVTRGHAVYIEATSLFGNEYDGHLRHLPEGKVIYFVGPDPYTKRNFYGTIEKKNGKVVVK